MQISKQLREYLTVSLASKERADELIEALDQAFKVSQQEIYVDGSGSDITGNGSDDAPYKTFQKAVAVAKENLNKVYTIIVGAGEYGGDEVSLPDRINITGKSASNTSLGMPISIISSNSPVMNISNIAMTGGVTADLTGSDFASVSFMNGAVGIERLDNNVNGIVSLSGGILNSTLKGKMFVTGALIYGRVDIDNDSDIIANNVIYVADGFHLKGNAQLTTLGCYNLTGVTSIDGQIDDGDTPTWISDYSSLTSYSGDLNRQILGSQSGSTSNRPTDTVAGYFYFDTTLGQPIWSKGDGSWVDGVGSSV